jgi:Uma2 family endonuclease
MAASTLLKKPASIPDPLPPEIEEILPKVELIYDDGEPMESDWHVKSIGILSSSTDYHFRGRDDYYVGGNMFIYFSEKQARNRDFRGPDYFYVSNTTREPIRKGWVTWLEEGRTPDAVIELCSPSTIAEDYGPKKDIYEKTLRVGDYFCYNRETRKLDGWRLTSKKYKPLVPNEHGWLWSEELGLWVGTWQGKVGPFDDTWLRFYDRSGKLVPTLEEAAQHRAEAAQHQAEAAQHQAEAAQHQAEAAQQQADAARQQVDAERARRETAEREIAELKAQLANVRKKPSSGNGNGKRKKK